MTIVATTRPPTVQISDGLRIDDAFAERLVEKMLISLDTSYGLVNFEMHEDKIRRASLGNPKGQKRIFKRMCKAGHNSILAAGITFGTRYRFNMRFDIWTATGSDNEDSEKGPLAWLVGRRLEFESKGVNHKTEEKMLELAGLSRHALERLVQRGACKTEADFIKVLRRAWLMLSLSVFALFEDRDHLPKGGETAWTLPVELETGETIYLVATRNARKGPYILVTTILTEDMGIDLSALAPLKTLLKEYEGKKDRGDIGKLCADKRLVPALQATAKATRRGRKEA